MHQMDVLLEELNVQVIFSKLNLTDPDIAEGTETTAAEIQKKLSQSPVTEMKSLMADKLKLLETCTV